MKTKIDQPILPWLLNSDVSIQYQVHRDLLNSERPDLQLRIAKEGWGARFLSCRNQNGHWGQDFYQPKWISSHYTLLDLKNLEIQHELPEAGETIDIILKKNRSFDGGVNPARSIPQSDVCVNGMFLNYAAYFKTSGEKLTSIVDFILSQQLPDGGFNCEFNRRPVRHSSLHSTLSVIEGISEYTRMGYSYRLDELQTAEKESREFILQHRLFKSHRTGRIIDKKMLMLSCPSRWRYDILRALDYFRSAGVNYDERMADAMEVLMKKQRADKTWPLQNRHAGQTHFEMEEPGKASRWNTLRAMRVAGWFGV